jgi:CelD/BcsL family acetyltransferase involved in cellulose biosynthesis
LADIDYFSLQLKTDKDETAPYVVLITQDNVAKTFLVGKIKRSNFGWKKITTSVRLLMIAEGGIAGCSCNECCTVLFQEIVRSLKQNEFDMIFFKEIPVDSHLYRSAQAVSGLVCHDYFAVKDLHYKMTLPDSADKFNMSKNTRKNLRRILKRFDEDFPGKVSVRCFRKKDDAGQFCRDAEEIAKKTYQHASGGGFLNQFSSSSQRHELLSLLAEREQFIGYIVYIEGRPCAFEEGILHTDTYFSRSCGYDPHYREYEVGTYLQLKIIEDFCNDARFHYIDFGFMDMFYKRRFCDISWKEASFYIFQPSIKGLFLNAFRAWKVLKRHVQSIIDRLGKRVNGQD